MPIDRRRWIIVDTLVDRIQYWILVVGLLAVLGAGVILRGPLSAALADFNHHLTRAASAGRGGR